ncbi:Interleukin-1 receptor-associated kinase [Entamoeba marina]
MKLKLLKEIDRNAEANIYKARYDGEIVAVRAYEPGYEMHEANTCSYFRNKYIVEYKGYGSLENVKHIIEQPVLCKIIEDVCKAIKYLHKNKHVMHRDIEHGKIFVCNYQEISDVNAKLNGATGCCDVINVEGNNGTIGTLYFMAPEVVNGENYSEKCDIYGLGITMLVSFLKIDYRNNNDYIIEEVQPNGTYIKNTTTFKSNILFLFFNVAKLILHNDETLMSV